MARGDRIVGALLGVVAGTGAAAVLVHLLSKSARASTVSPRETSLPPSAPLSPALSSSSLPTTLPIPGGSIYGQGGSFDPDYPPEVWRPIVALLIVRDFGRIPLAVAMQWLSMESDGAPCSFGKAGQVGPDGQPREIGLGQIYNPDDFQRLGLLARGITAATFRAYCAPGTQRRTRRLTPQEMEDLARHTLLDKIEDSRKVADRAIEQHGLHWGQADYWKLVKSVHAWPPILNKGLPSVIKKLGRAPASWSEFRQELGMDEMIKDQDRRSKTYGQMIPKFPVWHRSLNNAEKLASVVPRA